VYNEVDNIPEMNRRLSKVFSESLSDYHYELVYIDDGSGDGSAEILNKLAGSDTNIKVISFSRNFGHQQAITAGCDLCTGDCAVLIDCDLQDPPEVIEELVDKWKSGFEVVYATRKEREGESFFKLITANLFYKLLNKITNIKIPVNTGDFRLIDRKVLDTLKMMPERNRFMRGMVAWIGFRQTSVLYSREKRFAGKTKYSLSKMIKFAFTGITSFSIAPLQLAIYSGFIVSGISLAAILYVIYLKFFTDKTILGWTSLILTVLFMGGIQLITIGIIGEYIGRISDEVKKRPVYIIKEKKNFTETEEE
jgi:dolichol-phosphate mannosyltransferase